MIVGGKEMDMTQAIVENYHRNNLDVLVCIGGGANPEECLSPYATRLKRNYAPKND